MVSQTTAPECTICGHAHWRHQPHVWGESCEIDSTAKVRKSSPPKSAPKLPVATDQPEGSHGSEPKPTAVAPVTNGTSATQRRGTKKKRKPALTSSPATTVRSREKYNAYMKLYMTDKRAADKLGISVKEYRGRKV